MVAKSVSSNESSSATAASTKNSSSKSYFSVDKLSMNNLFDQIKKADKDLDSVLSKQPFILKLERQSGIKKTQMVYGLAALVGIFLLYRLATNFVITVVLLAYPFALSLEAVESHDKAKDAQILSYWSILAGLQLLEATFPFIRRYIPFYNLLKLTLAVYLYLPQTKGSLIAYDMLFKPLLGKVKAAKQSGSKSVPLKKSSSTADSAEN